MPVLASRAASIPEVVGESALLLDPDDWKLWADAITQVMTDSVLRARLRADGLSRAAMFTWERTLVSPAMSISGSRKVAGYDTGCDFRASSGITPGV